MKSIAIIGAGQLGCRHLQALTLIKSRSVQIFVLDPSIDSLSTAKSRFNEFQKANSGIKAEFYSSLSELPENLDLAIISTSSDVRRNIIEELLKICVVPFLILEKVLFQAKEDYYFIEDLLRVKKIKAWVNCPRRMNPSYKILREKFIRSDRIELTVNGSGWGLGCNLIHFLDLVAFLTGNSLGFKIDNSLLDKEIIDSKRKNFKEFTGNVSGTNERGDSYSITSHKQGSAPLFITIQSDQVRCVVEESSGKFLLSEQNSKWEWQTLEYKTLFQSQLTNLAVENIFQNGECELTEYSESARLHIAMIDTLCAHLNNITGTIEKTCPIT